MALASALTLNLDSLVDDVLIHILSILSVWDVLHVRQTSKRMEALSRVRAVWHALFSRDVLKRGRPVPGFSFAPTPRLMQLFALDPASDLYHAEFSNDTYDSARELIESSDLEARTVHALRLEKFWSTPVSTSANSSSNASTGETRLRTFRTPTPVRDIFLLPGGRFVVSAHADRLRCWDLGVPHAPSDGKARGAARCVGEWVFSRTLAEATTCMDARAPVYWRDSSSVSFTLCADVVPSWTIADAAQQKRTCEILSVRSDPLRAGPFDLHGGSPFASPVPFFQRELVLSLPDTLPTPVYPEQSSVPEEWGPHRFANGKLGKLLLTHGSLLFFASYIPPAPGAEDEENEPRYAGIEVLDWNAPSKTVLFEYPDPQVGPYIGLHVHASAAQVLVVWQNCAGLYPLPLSLPSLSSLSSAPLSRPSSPSLASSSSSSPGSSRSGLDVSGVDANARPARTVMMPTIVFALSEPVEAPVAFSVCSVDGTCTRTGTNSKIRSEPPHPLTILARSRSHPSRNVQSVLTASPSPSRSSFYFSFSSSATNPQSDNDKYVFRLSRIPAPTPHFMPPSTGSEREGEGEGAGAEEGRVVAVALGASGRGVRADRGGALYRCARAEVVLPSFGYGSGFSFGLGFGSGSGEAGATAVPTVDFWPWRRAAVLPSDETESVEDSESDLDLDLDLGAGAGMESESESDETKLVVRFDDGMGRIVAARVPLSARGRRQGHVAGARASEVTVLDFA